MSVQHEQDPPPASASAPRKPLRVVIAGGGTGGHVIPALAVGEQLRLDHPANAVLFVGSADGLEQRLVPQRGFDLRTIAVGKLKGARWQTRLRTVGALPAAVLRASRLLRAFEPDAVIGVGGYASAPVAVAAALARLPVVLLEQNAIPGVTNRALSRLARRVVVSFASSARWFPDGRVVHLGNPLATSWIEGLSRNDAPAPPGPMLLVLGGSQGAQRVNELVVQSAPELSRRVPALHIVHQTGKRDRARVADAYRTAGIAARVEAFIDHTAGVYRHADLMVGRAGATTCAELMAAGVPAVLIPYPFAADDHQTANARALADAGAARLMIQSEATASTLTDELTALLGNGELLNTMRQTMRRLARPQAAAHVVDLLRRLVAA